MMRVCLGSLRVPRRVLFGWPPKTTSPPVLTVRAAILDWAGVVVDWGSAAPAQALVQLFGRHGVHLRLDETLGPMGRGKLDHIRQLLLHTAGIRTKWCAAHQGSAPSEATVRSLFDEYEAVQLEVFKRDARGLHSRPFPEVVPAVTALRKKHNVVIGSTSGYSQPVLDALRARAARHGYSPLCAIGASNGIPSRPFPYQLHYAMQALQVQCVSQCVVVGDTEVDAEAARNAGMWMVGVFGTGPYLGVSSQEQWLTLSLRDRHARLFHARKRLLAAGCHYVIPDLSLLPDSVAAINDALSLGVRPA